MVLKHYLLLFVAQSVCAAVLISQCPSIYSGLLRNPGNPQHFQGQTMALIALSAVVMQSAYWYRVFNIPLPVENKRVVTGHVILFIGRLLFIVATSLFSVVLYRHMPEIEFARNWSTILSHGVLLLAMLFSLYCYTAELERLGVALRGQGGR